MPEYKKLAIMGAGAMGTLLGAVLTSKGCDITLIDVDTVHVDALRKNGATVKGSIALHVPVKAVTPEELDGKYDLVFLMVKQLYNESALKSLLPRLHDSSIVCTLQNGMPERAVAEFAGIERTMGCAVTWAATAAGPGATFATSPTENWHASLGRLDGEIAPNVIAVRDILSLMCPTEITQNLDGIRWSKLLINSALSGVSSVLGCTFGALLNDPSVLRCVQEVARECVHVAAALGVRLEPLAPGEDLAQLMDYASETERLEKSAIFNKMLGGPENPGKASMLQDLEKSRRTEIDFLNGELQKGGLKAGVPTPRCDKVVALIHAIESGQRAPAMDNLKALADD